MSEISDIMDMKENIPPNSRGTKSCAEDVNHAAPMQTTWDVDVGESVVIYSDMGVEPITESENSCDSVVVLEATPMDMVRQEHRDHAQPNAPQVLRDLPVSSVLGINQLPRGITPLKTRTQILRDDDNFLCRRGKPAVIGQDHFTKLSDEIILSILRWIPKFFLARCATVCKRWSRLILDETIWRRIDLSNKSLREGVLGCVLSRGVCVLRLSKAEISNPIFTPNRTYSRYTKVQYLDLSMAEITEEGLEELLDTSNHIKKLSLENCSLNQTICHLISENLKLEVLNLCMCRGITIDCAIALLASWSRVRSLNLAWTNLDSHTIMYIMTALPTNLSKLNLSGFRENICDDDITKLVELCPNLNELDISDSTILTSATISTIAQNLHQLEYLAISRCYHITVSHLPELLAIPTLLALDVFGMLMEDGLVTLRASMSRVSINKYPLSSIARPTTGIRRTSIWGLRVRDSLN